MKPVTEQVRLDARTAIRMSFEVSGTTCGFVRRRLDEVAILVSYPIPQILREQFHVELYGQETL